jgi:hypothetical protein
MRRWIGIIALLLVVGAVFIVLREPSRSNFTATDETSSTTAAPATRSTDTTVARTTPPTTAVTGDEVTDTTGSAGEPTTEPADPAEPKAVFAITELQFGENGFVAIRNVGSAPGSLDGYALCSGLRYFQIPDIELAPLEIAWIAFGDGATLGGGAGIAEEVVAMNGRLGTARRAGGEMGLYNGSNFGDPELLLTYVAWGDPEQPRAQVAVDAGIWEEGAVLAVPSDAFGIQSVAPGRPAAGLEDWTAGVGG